MTTNKNLLGYVLFVLGLFFIAWMFTKHEPHRQERQGTRRVQRDDMLVTLVFLVIIAYLFKMADSKTPLVALAAASGVVFSLRFAVIQRHFGKFAALGLITGAILQMTVNINKAVVEGVGRDTTLTGRTEIWDKALGLVQNPVLGAGFETFWLGDRLLAMWKAFPVFLPNQAHNGYLEMYLNLGAVGLILFVIALGSSYRSLHGKLLDAISAPRIDRHELMLSVFGIAYFVAYLLYNVTEATYKPLTVLFLVFLAIMMRYTPQRWHRRGSQPQCRIGDRRETTRGARLPGVEPDACATGPGRDPATGFDVAWETSPPSSATHAPADKT